MNKSVEEPLIGLLAALWLAATAKLSRESHGEVGETRLATVPFELVLERFADGFGLVQPFRCGKLAGQGIALAARGVHVVHNVP